MLRTLFVPYTSLHMQQIEEFAIQKTKKLITQIQNDPNCLERREIMRAIKIELNRKQSETKKKLADGAPGLWLVTDDQSPDERARREKLNLELRKQGEEWKELEKVHREGWNDTADQHDDCNSFQREGSTLEELANSGNVFAKRLMALTSTDPLVLDLGLFKKFSVNPYPSDVMFASLARPSNEIANDFIGMSKHQFVGDLPRRDLEGIEGQESLDRFVQEHLDSGSVPPSQIGIVMKTFAASICSRLDDGDFEGTQDMLLGAQKAWKLLTPYYSKYRFGAAGSVDVIPPPKNPLLNLMSRIDPQWGKRAGSVVVKEFYNMMN